MSKNLIIALVIGVFILAGIGAYMVLGNRDSGQSIAPEQAQQAEQMQDQVVEGRSLIDLMRENQNLTCTYSGEDIGSGTVYLSSGRVRGEFEIETDEGVIDSNIISVDQKIYVWSDDSEQGVTFSVEEIEDVNEEEQRPNTVDLEEKFDYQCSRWSVNEDFFVPPADIEFIDFGEFMDIESIMQSDQEPIQGTQEQCAACEGLSGEARTQCLNALGC